MPFKQASQAPIDGEFKLVQRAQAGDQESFARLYDAYMERIYRYVFFRVNDALTAEDITAQVFMKAWERLDTYKDERSPFLAWLYQVARNAVIDHTRTSKTAIALEEVDPAQISFSEDIDEKIDQKTRLQEIRSALQVLTEEQQQVLLLKFANGLKTPEIARLLGKEQGAIRALQMRALQGLAKALGVME
jgi:RNA polymerase sigma-70 factor, ECF subfamily